MSNPVWRLFCWLFGPQWLRELDAEKEQAIEVLLSAIAHPGTRELVPLARTLAENYKRLEVIAVNQADSLEVYRKDSRRTAQTCHDAAERVGMTADAWGRLVPDALADEILRLRAAIAGAAQEGDG